MTDPDPLGRYHACIEKGAARIGTRSSITANQAKQVVEKCMALLPGAAAKLVNDGYKTNAPAQMQTRSNLLRAAALDIEQHAKMSISAHVPALPPR